MKSEEVLKFSVIILMYNNSLNQILLTTKSVIQQKLDDFEIIFADDGSELQYKNEIEHFLIENKFMNYCFAPSDKNLGTVCNILRAISFARGRFIKCIGAGDYLFDENVLNDVYSFMVQNDCQWIFGKMRGYYIQNFQIKNKFYRAPLNQKVYRRINQQEIKKRIVVYQDHISGAAMFFEKYFLTTYLIRLKNTVKYVEDIFQVLAALDDIFAQFFPRVLIGYEYGSGISTSCENPLVKNDFKQFEKYLETFQNPLIDERVKRNTKLSEHGYLYRHIYYLIESPICILLDYCRKKGWFSIKRNLGFLEEEWFYNELGLYR